MSDESKDNHSQDKRHDTLSKFLKEFESHAEKDIQQIKTSEASEANEEESSISTLANDSITSPEKTKTSATSTHFRQDKSLEENRKQYTETSSKPNKKKQEENKESGWFSRFTEITTSAFNIAKKTTGTSFKVGKVLMDSQDQLRLMLAAGQTLKDLREVAGLTISELSDAINLGDKTLLVAVENGTSALSFELILRLASLLARNDPIPFIIKLTRAYSPETWRILTDWGLGRIPLQYEREREFINIYRSHDEARKLSDEGFKKVLEFTRTAFEMSLHFIAEQENVLPDKQANRKEDKINKSSNKEKKQQPEE